MSRYSVEAILSVKGAERFRTAFENASKSVERMERVSGRVRDVSRRIGSIGDTLTNKITKPAIGAATALAGVTLFKGFRRLVGIDTARAQLVALGHDAKSVDDIMTAALASVKGTAYGMDEAATTAASAVAAGVDPVKELERYLSLAADTAAIANADFGEMGSIFNKIQTSNRATNRELQQLAERGIPIYEMLADEIGTTSDAISDMASKGEISTDVFLKAIEKNIGGAAKIIGEESFMAAVKNVGADIARIGAAFLDAGGEGGGFFSKLKPMITDLRERLDKLEGSAAKAGEKFGQAFENAVEKVKELKRQYDDLDPRLQDMIKRFAIIAPIIAIAAGPILQFARRIGLIIAWVLPFVSKAVGMFKVLGAALTGLSVPAWIVIGIIAALVGGFVMLWKKSEAFREGVTNAFNAVREAVVNSIGHVSEFIQEVFGFIVDWWKENQELILKTSETVWNKINEKIETVMSFLVPLITENWELVKTIVSVVWEAIKTTIMVAMELIGGVITAVMHIINGDWDKAWETVKETFIKIWERIQKYSEKVTTIINDYIEKKLEQAKGFIRDKWEEAKQYFIDKFNDMKNEAIKKGQEIVQTVKDKFEDAKRTINEKLEDAKTAVSNKIGEIPSIITGIGPKLFDAGRNIISSLISGITSRISSIREKMGEVASIIRGYLPFSPAKFGALRDIMKVRIAESIAESIERGKKQAIKAMANLTSAMDTELYVGGLDSMSVRRDIAYEIEATQSKQPAYVVVRVGNSEFTRFVEDITDTQNRNENIRRSFA